MSEAADRIEAYLDDRKPTISEPRTIVRGDNETTLRTDDLRALIAEVRAYDGLGKYVAERLSVDLPVTVQGVIAAMERELRSSYHDEGTPVKVANAIRRATGGKVSTSNVINEMLNAGILFRERSPEPQLMKGEEITNTHAQHPFALAHEELPMRYWVYRRWSGKEAHIRAERLTFEPSGHVVAWTGDLPVFAEKREDVNSLRLISNEEARERGLPE